MQSQRGGARKREVKSRATLPGARFDQLRILEKAIGSAKLKPIMGAIRRVDWDRFDDLAQLLRDDFVEIIRTKPNLLMQRNVWPALDAVALELDKAKLMPALQATIPLIKDTIHLDDKEIVLPSWKYLLGFLGLTEKRAQNLGLTLRDLQHTAAEAERDIRGARTYRNLTAKGLTFTAGMRNACARPVQILAVPWWAKLIGLALIVIAIQIWKAAAGPPPNWQLFALGAVFLLVGLCLLVNC